MFSSANRVFLECENWSLYTSTRASVFEANVSVLPCYMPTSYSTTLAYNKTNGQWSAPANSIQSILENSRQTQKKSIPQKTCLFLPPLSSSKPLVLAQDSSANPGLSMGFRAGHSFMGSAVGGLMTAAAYGYWCGLRCCGHRVMDTWMKDEEKTMTLPESGFIIYWVFNMFSIVFWTSGDRCL